MIEPVNEEVEYPPHHHQQHYKSQMGADREEHMEHHVDQPGANISPTGTAVPVEQKKPRFAFKVNTLNMATQFNTVLPSQTQRDGMNLAYARSIGGILKLITILLAAIIFCVAIQGFGVSGTWTFVLAHTTMIVVGGLTAVNLLAPHLLDDMRTRTAVTILELSFYLWMSILWFVAIWLTVADAAGQSKEKQGVAIFCIVLNIIMTALFVFQTFLKFIEWRKSQSENTLPPGVVHSQHSTV